MTVGLPLSFTCDMLRKVYVPQGLTDSTNLLCTAVLWIALSVGLTSCGRAAPEHSLPQGRPTGPQSAGQPAGQRSATSPSPQAQSFYTDDFHKTPTVPGMTRVGRLLFFDPACQSRENWLVRPVTIPAFAFGPAPSSKRVAALQGVVMDRAIPSLRYMQDIPPFSEHHFDESADESVDQGPTGGHMWDGRADTLHDQAKLPLFSPREMANASADEVVQNVRQGAYAASMREVFGEDVFDDPKRGFKAILKALEVFQQSPPEFYPYNSKYDAWLRNQTKLTAQELRGLAVFNDPAKGNRPAATRVRFAVAAFHSSPILVMLLLAYPAIARWLPTRILTTTIWVCADRCGATSRIIRNIVAASRRPHFATYRCARPSFTTVS